MNELNHAAGCRLGFAILLTLFVGSGCVEVRYDTNVKTSTLSQSGVQSVVGKYDNMTAYSTAGSGEGGRVYSNPQSGVKYPLGKYDKVTAHYSSRPGGSVVLQQGAAGPQTNPEKPAFVPIALEAGDVFFEFDTWVISESFLPELDRWVEFLQMNRLMTAEIYGHTDSRGSDKYNQQLSEKRAQAVIDYLVEKGVAEKRLTVRGVGESQPVAPNSSDEGRHKNRRVEAEVKF